jgi:hypothetical protein
MVKISKQKPRERNHDEKTTITLQYDLATGKVNLNERVYRLKEIREHLMLQIFEGTRTTHQC